MYVYIYIYKWPFLEGKVMAISNGILGPRLGRLELVGVAGESSLNP